MMRILTSFLALQLACCGLFAQIADSLNVSGDSRKDRLSAHVYTLADDSMKGREAGSEDAARAREYIVNQFSQMGLAPFRGDSYEIGFSRYGVGYSDVVGVIKGNELADEYIVVGAHYDHIGVNAKGETYNGADDNASGTAAIIEIARELISMQKDLKRSVIIAAFDAEEKGLYGSEALCTILTEDGIIDKVKLMMSLDMVGWYGKSGNLQLQGVGTIQSGKELVAQLAKADAITIKTKKFEDSIFTATDTDAFAKAGVPTLAVTTGLKSPYHKVGDDPDLIDYDGLDKVVSFTTDLTATVSESPDYSPSGKIAEKHRSTVRAFQPGINVYLGGMSMNLNKSGVKTSGEFSYGAGASLQYNHKYLGIRAELIYLRQKSYIPDVSDIYFSKAEFKQSSITVPVLLLAQTPVTMMPFQFSAGVGPFYSRVLDWSGKTELGSDLSKNGYGIQLTLGLKVGHFVITANNRWSLSPTFTNPSMPARAISTDCGLSWYF